MVYLWFVSLVFTTIVFTTIEQALLFFWFKSNSAILELEIKSNPKQEWQWQICRMIFERLCSSLPEALTCYQTVASRSIYIYIYDQVIIDKPTRTRNHPVTAAKHNHEPVTKTNQYKDKEGDSPDNAANPFINQGDRKTTYICRKASGEIYLKVLHPANGGMLLRPFWKGGLLFYNTIVLQNPTHLPLLYLLCSFC